MKAVLAFLLVIAAQPVAAQPFDPVDFFRGRTHGEGTLKPLLQKSKIITVDSVGTEQKDGTLQLKQVINEPGKPPRTRYWRMRRDGNGYSGTLTDAAGPVRVTVEGDSIRIRYKAKDKLDFDQQLTATGPKTVRNRMKIRRLGIILAHFDETITKLD